MEQELAQHIASLRAFARSLCRDPVQAEDLTQETLMKAWANRARFELGTNLQAWLFTILRNQFYSNLRKRRLELEDSQRRNAAATDTAPAQLSRLDFDDFCRALHLLSAEQREAIVLVGAGGLSYGETAIVCRCAVGTVKSRVARGRAQLIELLEGAEPLPSIAASAPTVRELAAMLGSREYASRRKIAGVGRKPDLPLLSL